MSLKPHQLIQIKHKHLTARKKAAVDAKAVCPILGVILTKESAVVDHKHISKEDAKKGKLGEDGKGLLRGVIHDQANVFIGKIEKGFVRSGSHKFERSISDQLRAIADYLEDPPIEQKYVHPSERLPKKELTKQEYARVKKYYFELYPTKRTLPPYPKSKIKSQKWIQLLNQIDNIRLKEKNKRMRRVKGEVKRVRHQ